MREIRADGKVAYLTDEQWGQLQHRFDLSDIPIGIPVSRPCLCPLFESDCRDCPLGIWKWESLIGCLKLLTYLGLSYRYLGLGNPNITIRERNGYGEAMAILYWLEHLSYVEDNQPKEGGKEG